jgi:uncharacterized membrane protein
VLGSLFPGAQHLQNVHPLIVHFPVALLPVAGLFYLLSWLSGRTAPAWTGMWLLVLGAVSAGVASASGLHAAEGVMVAASVREALLEQHERWMLGVTATSGVLALWALAARPLPRRGRLGFLFLLGVLSAAMAHGADYGGRLVYDYNAGGNACGQPIEFSR